MVMTVDEARRAIEQAEYAKRVLAEAEDKKKRVVDAIKKAGFRDEGELVSTVLESMDPKIRKALVRAYLDNTPIGSGGRRRTRLRVGPEAIARAKALYKERKNYAYVARELGCSNVTAKKLVTAP